MTSQIIYKGELRTNATHIQSGTVIETDAPTDNMGKGERFSPTDLVAVALGTCMVTTMAIRSQSMELRLDGTQVDVTKIMASNPRRISQLVVAIRFPEELVIDEEKKKFLEHIALTCPVQKSLSSDIAFDTQFTWHNGNGEYATTVHSTAKENAPVAETPKA